MNFKTRWVRWAAIIRWFEPTQSQLREVVPLIELSRASALYAAALWSTCAANCAWAAGYSFTPLGDLPGGSFSSHAFGVSADGAVVVGASASESGREAFRWTRSEGMIALGDLPGGQFESRAGDVSDDGSVIVGTGATDQDIEAWRWTASGMVSLGDLPDGFRFTSARAVSGDGSTIVGTSYRVSDSRSEAVRWRSTGVTHLGDLPGGFFSSDANSVSDDGRVVVGGSWTASRPEAFRWTETGGMVSMGSLPGDETFSEAVDVSTDGLIVVGTSTGTTQGERPFRWSTTGGMRALGQLAGHSACRPYGMSGDGRIVIGKCDPPNPGDDYEAFVWSDPHGIQSLASILETNGVDLTGWALQQALDISRDGRAIVGYAINPTGNQEAFLATIPEPTTWWLSIAAITALYIASWRRKSC
jgi:probable HAF family extracellular repeat protein